MEADGLSCLPFKLRVKVDGVPVKLLDVDAGMVEGDEAGSVPGGPLRQVGFFEQNHVLIALLF